MVWFMMVDLLCFPRRFYSQRPGRLGFIWRQDFIYFTTSEYSSTAYQYCTTYYSTVVITLDFRPQYPEYKEFY